MRRVSAKQNSKHAWRTGHYLLIWFIGPFLHTGLLLLPVGGLTMAGLGNMTASRFVFLLLVNLFYFAEQGALAQWTQRIEGEQKMELGLVTFGLSYGTAPSMLAVFWLALWQNCNHPGKLLSLATLLGVLGMGGGIFCRFSAIRELQDYFRDQVTVCAGQPLIQTGLYKYMRHPSELGNVLIAVGACLLLQSQLAFGVTVALLLPLVIIRIRMEDRRLADAYPDDFGIYAKSVKRLIPQVY